MLALRNLRAATRPGGRLPFSMASPRLVDELLTAAGWSQSPAGEIVREAGAHADGKREAIVDELRQHFVRHLVAGRVVAGSASFTIGAINRGPAQ